jgi:hypothetical protein
MATMRREGLDDLFKEMAALGESMGEVADRMLLAGAEEVKKSWREVATQFKYKDTGRMIESIGYGKGRSGKASDVKAVAIYPQGINHKNVRNAEVAYILHYGTSKRQGSHWVDKAEELAGPRIEKAVTEIWDEELRKRGFN